MLQAVLKGIVWSTALIKCQKAARLFALDVWIIWIQETLCALYFFSARRLLYHCFRILSSGGILVALLFLFYWNLATILFFAAWQSASNQIFNLHFFGDWAMRS